MPNAPTTTASRPRTVSGAVSVDPVHARGEDLASAWVLGAAASEATHVLLLHEGDQVSAEAMARLLKAAGSADVVRVSPERAVFGGDADGAAPNAGLHVHLLVRRELVADLAAYPGAGDLAATLLAQQLRHGGGSGGGSGAELAGAGVTCVREEPPHASSDALAAAVAGSADIDTGAAEVVLALGAAAAATQGSPALRWADLGLVLEPVLAEGRGSALGSSAAARLRLVRDGRADLLSALDASDAALAFSVTTSSVTWHGEQLEVALEARLHRTDGQPALTRSDQGLRWTAPADVLAHLGAEALQVGPIDGPPGLVLLPVGLGLVAGQATDLRVAQDANGDGADLTWSGSVTLTLQQAQGAAEGGAVQVGLRVQVGGATIASAVQVAPTFQPRVSVVQGQPVSAYGDEAGRLTLDPGGRGLTLAQGGGASVDDVTLSGSTYLKGLAVSIRWPDVAVTGHATGPATLWVSVDMPFAGQLVTDGAQVRLDVADVLVPPGGYRLGVQVGSVRGWMPLRLVVHTNGGSWVVPVLDDAARLDEVDED